ncbi:MAG: metal-dependent transcriptional regulator [Chloroflexi bacterium]|nr:metal-dependent transcriptional regulator [Chloroflexota bacterium]
MPARSRKARTELASTTGASLRRSPVVENYLLALYILREEGVRATLSHLAEYLKQMPPSEGLGTSLPSIAGMARRMEREGLVEVGPNRELGLTAQGLLLAEDMVRRHRLAERLAVDVLGIDLHRAHIEAHRLEHAISPEIQARIVQLLGNPKTCPFGRPIPGSGYTPPTDRVHSLDKAKERLQYLVDRVPEEDEQLLQFLVLNAVVPNKTITVQEVSPFRGVVVFDSESRRGVSVSYAVAARIWVRTKE